MDTNVNAQVDQLDPTLLGEGNQAAVKQSKIGQLFTAGWRQRLTLAGKVWKFHVGAITADTAVTLLVGGGAGTSMDIEQPEMIIGVDEGYSLIPLEIDVSVDSDTDLPDDFMEILALADRTNAPPQSVTGTVATPVNLLDGGPAFPGRAFTAITVDIVDPVLAELLMYRRQTQREMVLNGVATNITAPVVGNLELHYEPEVPSILAGPCSVVLIFDGSVATSGMATITVAAVPSTWFPTS